MPTKKPDLKLNDLRVGASTVAGGVDDFAPRRMRLLSPLTSRFLAVNLAAPVLLVLGLLFLDEYQDTLANPYMAAERGYIDRVILPHETRAMVTRALRALRNKRESRPPKKHGNIPL